MSFVKALQSLIRRIRSVIVLVITISLLFYYTFQNEINMLNSFAENEYIQSADSHFNANRNEDLMQGAMDLITNVESTEIDLTNPDILREKNKYFPLLLQDASKDPTVKLGIPKYRDASSLLTYKEKHPVLNEMSLPLSFSYVSRSYPSIQSNFFEEGGLQQNDFLAKIRQVFVRNWAIDVYSRTLAKIEDGEWPLLLVDSIDTLFIMGQLEEFDKAVQIISKVDFRIPPESVNVVDIPDYSTRLLGGLVSAYELSQNQILLKKAKQVADFVLRSFDTPNRIPILQYEWRSKISNMFPYQNSTSGGLSSMTLELLRLSQITRTSKYFDAVEKIYRALAASSDEFALPYMFPLNVDASGCSLISQRDVSAGKHLRDSKGMKSIDENLNFVHCHQTGKLLRVPSRKKGEVDFFSMDAQAQSVYANMVKSLHLLNGNDLLKISEDSDENSESDPQKVESGALNEQDRSKVGFKGGISIRRIFSDAMDQVNDYMTYVPNSPLSDNLTFISSLRTRSQLVPATNDLNVEITKLFDMHHERCSLASTLGMGSQILKMNKYVTLAANITTSCFELFKLLDGVYVKDLHLDPCDNPQCSFDAISKIKRVQKGYHSSSEIPEDAEIEEGIKLTDEDHKSQNMQRVITFGRRQGLSTLNLDLNDIDMKTLEWKHDPKMPLWVNFMGETSILSSNVIESVFYMYRITGETNWREMGRELFEMTMKTMRDLNSGAKGVWTVKEIHDDPEGKYLSAWYSQTLKYYYLLFSDAVDYSLDDYVFTFGGHLLKREEKMKDMI